MRRILGPITAVMLLVSPLAGWVQDACADLNDVAKALGASTVKSIQYTGTGGVNAPGQSVSPTARGSWRSIASRASCITTAC